MKKLLGAIGALGLGVSSSSSLMAMSQNNALKSVNENQYINFEVNVGAFSWSDNGKDKQIVNKILSVFNQVIDGEKYTTAQIGLNIAFHNDYRPDLVFKDRTLGGILMRVSSTNKISEVQSELLTLNFEPGDVTKTSNIITYKHLKDGVIEQYDMFSTVPELTTEAAVGGSWIFDLQAVLVK